MGTELTAPEGMTLEGAVEAMRGALAVREGRVRTRDRSFYDTFDRRLSAAGMSLWHEDGHLEVAGCREAMRRPIRPLRLADLPAGEVRDALAPVIGMRALLPLGRVHSQQRDLDVLDSEEKTVVRVVLAGDPALGVRATLAGLRGYDDELERVRRVLADELGFRPAEQTLADSLAPASLPARARVHRGQAAGDAVAAMLAHLLDVIEANLDGTLADIDSEFLHDLRVAVRRSRSVQKELREVFDPAELEFFRSEFRWVQEVTGPTRDLDVWLLEFDDYRALVDPRFRGGLDPVLEVLQGRRRRAFVSMSRALRSERAGALRARWRRYLVGMTGAGSEKIEQLAGPRIERLYRKMVKAGRGISDDSPAESLHELRKQGKELRYMLELFGSPLYGDEVVRPLVRALKGLQDVLGRHQDRAVQAAMVASLRDDLTGRPDALVAMGALAQALIDDERAARSDFARRFAEFASPRTRNVVKDAFR